MSDLFGNHIVGFSTRWLIYFQDLYMYTNILKCQKENIELLFDAFVDFFFKSCKLLLVYILAVEIIVTGHIMSFDIVC